MNALIKALKLLIEADGSLHDCCSRNNFNEKCEFCYREDSRLNYLFDCEVFKICIDRFDIDPDALIEKHKAKSNFEIVLNKITEELIIE